MLSGEYSRSTSANINIGTESKLVVEDLAKSINDTIINLMKNLYINIEKSYN